MKRQRSQFRHRCQNDPDFLEILRNSGLRATKPRVVFLDFLFHEHGPFTPEEIFKRAGGKVFDLTTAYRTALTLEKADLLTRCEFGDGMARYEFRGNSEASEHHHHVICRDCKRATPLHLCLLPSWEQELTDRGFTNPGHSLEFFGTCQDCRKAG